jgi:mannose/fructose-specific phosphotransferase system component IIA
MSKAISTTPPSVCDLGTSETRSGTKFWLQLVIVTDSDRELIVAADFFGGSVDPKRAAAVPHSLLYRIVDA